MRSSCSTSGHGVPYRELAESFEAARRRGSADAESPRALVRMRAQCSPTTMSSRSRSSGSRSSAPSHTACSKVSASAVAAPPTRPGRFRRGLDGQSAARRRRGSTTGARICVSLPDDVPLALQSRLDAPSSATDRVRSVQARVRHGSRELRRARDQSEQQRDAPKNWSRPSGSQLSVRRAGEPGGRPGAIALMPEHAAAVAARLICAKLPIGAALANERNRERVAPRRGGRLESGAVHVAWPKPANTVQSLAALLSPSLNPQVLDGGEVVDRDRQRAQLRIEKSWFTQHVDAAEPAVAEDRSRWPRPAPKPAAGSVNVALERVAARRAGSTNASEDESPA